MILKQICLMQIQSMLRLIIIKKETIILTYLKVLIGDLHEININSIPKRTLIWRMVQDHVEKFTFAARIWDLYFIKWRKFMAKIRWSPTISFRA